MSAPNLNKELMEAVAACDSISVQRLLESGADAAFIDDPEGVWGSRSKKGPLHMALGKMRGEQNSEKLKDWSHVVQSLVVARADVNAESAEYDWRGCGSTSTAFELALPKAMKDPDLLELFLAHGADANTKTVRDVHSMRTDGSSTRYILHQAVEAGNFEVTRALLDAGAHVDAKSSEIFHNERGFNRHMEETPLHRACAAADLAMAALLLARGADVNTLRRDLEQVHQDLESPTDDPRDPDFVSSVICLPIWETALHQAICAKSPNLIVMLMCAGADSSVPRLRGNVKKSCEELCEGDESLLKALRAEWSPETHSLFPKKVQESVEAAFMVAHRQQWPLPDTLLFRICAMSVGPPSTSKDIFQP